MANQQIFNDDSRFDIDLRFGKMFEGKVSEMLKGTVEVKTDRIWRRTGNIAIEVASRGNFSGICSTEADFWIQVLLDKDDSIFCCLCFPVPVLMRMCKDKFVEGDIHSGGDDGTSEMVLFKLKELFNVSSGYV